MSANLLERVRPALRLGGYEDPELWAPPDEPDDDPIRWSDLEPSGLLLDAVSSIPMRGMAVDALLDRVSALERIAARVAAEQAIATAAFAAACRARAAAADLPVHEVERARRVADELSLELRISSRTADARIATAEDLSRLQGTLEALRAGRIGVGHAYAIRDEAQELSDDHVAAVEDRVLADAERQTPGQLRRRARKAVQSIDPDAATQRRKEAATKRRVRLYPEPDGMATLHVRLPGPVAVAVYNRLNGCAKAAKARGDKRNLDQLRADALVEVLCHGAGPAAKPLIHIIVRADTLSGHNDQPAQLDGYGPIDAELARRIAATGTWKRLVTDPVNGQALDVGRTRYRPPKALADYVRARDRVCYFATCLTPADRCELDHLVAWEHGGRTDAANLDVGCPRHHDLKHDPNWQLVRHDDGSYTVTTPTGRQHTTPPATPLDDDPPF